MAVDVQFCNCDVITVILSSEDIRAAVWNYRPACFMMLHEAQCGNCIIFLFFPLFLLKRGSWKRAWCNTGAHNRPEEMGVLGLSLEDKLAQDNRGTAQQAERGGRRATHSCRRFSSFQIVAEMTGRQWNADYPKLIGRCDKNETKEAVIGAQQQSSELETKDREYVLYDGTKRTRKRKTSKRAKDGLSWNKKKDLKKYFNCVKTFPV